MDHKGHCTLEEDEATERESSFCGICTYTVGMDVMLPCDVVVSCVKVCHVTVCHVTVCNVMVYCTAAGPSVCSPAQRASSV